MYSHAAQGVKHGGLSKLGYINIEQIEKYRRKDELVAMAAAGGRIVQGQHLELRPAVKLFIRVLAEIWTVYKMVT